MGKPLNLLHEISFSLKERETFVLVGESGSGKTTLARALTKLFPPKSKIRITGEVRFEGYNLLQLGGDSLRDVRRSQIRYIFQEPASALNPTLQIRTQFRLAASLFPPAMGPRPRSHDNFIESLLARVGIEQPAEVLSRYPHQLSVGTLQRILIAMAIAPNPRLLVADEPTSAVDASMRIQILDLLRNLCEEGEMGLFLITHDLSLARQYADRVAVLYAGRIVEMAQAEEFFKEPFHPYSWLLVESMPGTDSSLPHMPTVPGTIPSVAALPAGCKFSPRCFKVQDDCRIEEPALISVREMRSVRCPYWK